MQRVVSTQLLRELAAGSTGLLAVPASVLAQLPDNALHVVTGPLGSRLPGELRSAQLTLDIGDDGASHTMVHVSPDLLAQLPSCFDVLRAATRLIPQLDDSIDVAVDTVVSPPDISDALSDMPGEGEWTGSEPF